MSRIQPPRATRWGRLSYDARHDSRRWSRRGRQRHNLLWSNLSLFPCHFRTHLICLFFKGRVPSEINQGPDNNYFEQQSHYFETDRKSSPGSIGICTVESRPGSPIPATTAPPRSREGTGHLARARTTQIDNIRIDTVAITRLAYTMRSCRRPRRAASA
jgi:hypothetical protein